MKRIQNFPTTNMKAVSPEISETQRTQDTRVTIHLPNVIDIELVQANPIRQYEIFNWLVTLTAPIAVGFWTAYVTTDNNVSAVGWSAIIFSTFTFLFLLLAIRYRQKVYCGSIKRNSFLKDFQSDKATILN